MKAVSHFPTVKVDHLT